MRHLLLPLLFGLIVFSPTLFAQTDSRALTNFTKVNIAGGFKELVLIPGDQNRLEVESLNNESTQEVESIVKDGAVNIALRNNSKASTSRYRLTLRYRQLEGINSAGSTNIITQEAVKADKFVYNMSGSGNLEATFDVGALECNFSGSGNMMAKGRADKIKFAVSGSSDVDASDLKAQSGKVRVSGSGQVIIHVQGDVDQVVSGSGSIRNVAH